MCEIQRNAGRLYSLEDLVGQVVSGTQLRQVNAFPKRVSCCKLRTDCVTKKLSMSCCSEDGQTKSHVKNVVMNVSRGLRREF